MNSKKILLLAALAAVFAVSSCSGLNSSCTTNCGGGNANLSITISDTPPTNTSVVSFSLPIIGITLTPSSGSAVSVFSSNPSTDFELTRLQSDTNLVLANQTVTAGSYTAINVTVAGPTGTFANSSSGTVGACVAGAFCGMTGNAATITYTFSSPLVLSSGGNQWVDLDFNYNNAIVTSSNVVGIDVTQPGVMTASSTVPVGVASGNFANIDDFTGAITALSGTSITLQSSLRGSLTAAITSSTPWYDPQGQCNGGGSQSCVGVGSIVSLQGLLSTSGLVNATSLDIIDASTAPADEVEGLIFPSSCNGSASFGMILSDSVIFTSGSPLTTSGFGSGVCLTIDPSATYGIDTGILSTQAVSPHIGFQSGSDLLPGQTVRARITGAASGTNGVNVTATGMLLRYSRVTATVSVAANVFTVTGLPGYFPTFSIPAQVQTYTGATLFEGTTDPNSLTGTVSFSAFFVNPTGGVQYPFYAAKVRQQ